MATLDIPLVSLLDTPEQVCVPRASLCLVCLLTSLPPLPPHVRAQLFSLALGRQVQTWDAVHSKKSTFSRGGVADLALAGDYLYTCGGDGLIKRLRVGL